MKERKVWMKWIILAFINLFCSLRQGPGWHGTYLEAQAGLEFETILSQPLNSGITGVSHHTQLPFIIFLKTSIFCYFVCAYMCVCTCYIQHSTHMEVTGQPGICSLHLPFKLELRLLGLVANPTFTHQATLLVLLQNFLKLLLFFFFFCICSATKL